MAAAMAADNVAMAIYLACIGLIPVGNQHASEAPSTLAANSSPAVRGLPQPVMASLLSATSTHQQHLPHWLQIRHQLYMACFRDWLDSMSVLSLLDRGQLSCPTGPHPCLTYRHLLEPIALGTGLSSHFRLGEVPFEGSWGAAYQHTRKQLAVQLPATSSFRSRSQSGFTSQSLMQLAD